MKATKRAERSVNGAPSTKRKQAPRHKMPTVLVVDDVPFLGEFLKPILRARARCRVVVAETSEKALRLAKHDEFDVVISDLSRPGMDGLQFLKAFKLAHPDTPVIIYSGALDSTRQRRAYRFGAFRCLSKPQMTDTILGLVREALEHRIARYADRPFSQMLAMGRAHLELVFFDLAVLERYATDPRYHFKWRCYSGWICIRDDFYLGDDMRERDKIFLKSFGLAYDGKHERVLAVYLADLGRLSPEHQQHWRTNQRSDECKVVKEYLDNTRDGIWGDTISFYAALLFEQAEINKLCVMIGRPRLFRKTFEGGWPDGYSIFLRPTKRNFLNFVQTLDKILSDNINQKFFGGDVPDQQIVEQRDPTREVKSPGTLTMLKNWLEKHVRFATPDGLDCLMKPFREVRDLRSRSAHQLVEDEYAPKYHKEQNRLVQDVHCSLASLRRLLASHPKARKYNPPDFLNLDKLRMF